MNKCFFIGKIIEMSDYKFFYNSKVHNAQISLKVYTLMDKYNRNETIMLQGYDEMADIIYKDYSKNDLVSIEGELNQKMEVNILDIEKC